MRLAAVLVFLGCERAPPPAPGNVSDPSKEEAPEAVPPSQETAVGKDSLPLADEKPESSWSAFSADGRAEVRQGRVREGRGSRCTTTSTVSASPGQREVMWKWDTCIATREQLIFVSPEGQRVIVIEPLPERLKGDWRGRDVVTLYEQGLRLKFLRAGAAVRSLDAQRWVRGTAGLPGTPPKYSADGTAIEFETVEGRAFRLGFDGEGFLPASEEARAFMASEGLYRYTDERGTMQVVGSVDEIPERYRSRAGTVKAKVSVQPASKPRASAPPAKESPPEKVDDTSRVPQLTPPPQLINEARETVEKVQEIRREQDRVLESLH
jgi:hypothetical protein